MPRLSGVKGVEINSGRQEKQERWRYCFWECLSWLRRRVGRSLKLKVSICNVQLLFLHHVRSQLSPAVLHSRLLLDCDRFSFLTVGSFEFWVLTCDWHSDAWRIMVIMVHPSIYASIQPVTICTVPFSPCAWELEFEYTLAPLWLQDSKKAAAVKMKSGSGKSTKWCGAETLGWDSRLSLGLWRTIVP